MDAYVRTVIVSIKNPGGALDNVKEIDSFSSADSPSVSTCSISANWYVVSIAYLFDALPSSRCVGEALRVKLVTLNSSDSTHAVTGSLSWSIKSPSHGAQAEA